MNLESREGAAEFLRQVDGHAPTSDQLDVIMGGAEPSLVIAGAGAGKTKTMALRVVYHVAAGHVKPAEVLGLTFTKKAANELATRISTMLRKAARIGETAIDEETVILSRPVVSTYNSFASAIATEHGLIVGVDPSARLITDAEQFQIINDLVRGWKGSFKDSERQISSLTKDVKELAADILNNELTTEKVRQALTEFRDHLLAIKADSLALSKRNRVFLSKFDSRMEILDVVDSYLQYKKVNQLTEYADQVAVANRVLRKRPSIGAALREEHKLVLLDEYQDTSVNNAKFLLQLFGGGHDVTAVGDPNQAIYGWRGASADALADFKRMFAAPGKPMPQYSLSLAFRNKGEILDVANAVAEPLRKHAKLSGLEVQPLEAFTKTGGEVELNFETLVDESYANIASDIARYREKHSSANNGRGPSIAVLCRARSAMEPMAKALEERGIPYIEHGNQTAISQPEVKTIRGLLRAVSNPSQGDSIMRMLTYLNISPADLEAMNAVRRSAGKQAGVDLSFVEALAHLEKADLSEAGRRRLQRLRGWLHTLTEARFSRIEDLVSLAIRITGLETEVYSRSASGGIGRASLSALQRLASGYSQAIEGATIEAFLDWLDLVEENEKGDDGELPLADLAVESDGVTKDELENPNTVTIMTIHGAKGLEWDYVAIPELRYGGFDLLKQNPKDPWLTSIKKIPPWLREDAASIPEWRWRAEGDAKALEESFAKWLSEDWADYENREIRRLAYVAMTRPRSRLFLAGYWYQNSAQWEALVKKMASKPRDPLDRGPSRLLLNLSMPTNGVSMTTPPEVNVDEGEEAQTALFIADQNRGVSETTSKAVEFVNSRVTLTPKEMEEKALSGSRWVKDSLADLQALLEGDERAQIDLGHLTANGVVQMASDQAQFRLDLERPIPNEPAHAARLGQQIHEHIASRYGAPRTGDLLDVSGDVDQVLGLDLNDPRVSRLIENFESIPFVKSGTQPIAVESPVDVVVAGVPMRGTIDAVFPDGTDDEGHERVRIVDWKTGRHPTAEDLPNRELQLHLYRLAWARVTGMDPRNISATFAYLGEKDEAKRLHHVGFVAEDELEAKIEGLIQAVKTAR
ncbi:MAG: ATP-dependent DNA helicase [Flaviflexus sp.]|uniref:ATP-dependent helicase n=1 Tax=Flaviflexus sp. TaxID=1969482 RepID=UPI00352C6D95